MLADFNINLGNRYQLALAELTGFKTQEPRTATTTASQQYYSYPAGTISIVNAVITVGSYKNPLTIVNSQSRWDFLNALTIQPSAIPQFIFPRKDDFGIWPTPQGAYTITFNGNMRDRNLAVDDYTTGTIGVTNASTAAVGVGTTFTAGMVDRWLEITSTAAAGHGVWYRIATFTSTTVLALDTPFEGTTATGLTYRICETPELPEEGHIILVDGVTADYYGGKQKDSEHFRYFDNKFWTGSPINDNREIGSARIRGGLIGLINRYSDRDKGHIVYRKRNINTNDKIWATTIA